MKQRSIVNHVPVHVMGLRYLRDGITYVTGSGSGSGSSSTTGSSSNTMPGTPAIAPHTPIYLSEKYPKSTKNPSVNVECATTPTTHGEEKFEQLLSLPINAVLGNKEGKNGITNKNIILPTNKNLPCRNISSASTMACTDDEGGGGSSSEKMSSETMYAFGRKRARETGFLSDLKDPAATATTTSTADTTAVRTQSENKSDDSTTESGTEAETEDTECTKNKTARPSWLNQFLVTPKNYMIV